VARVLIVGGGCRGRRLASELTADGHAVRITTRTEAGRAAIEATGSECWIGTPDRLGTLRGALESVTVACWLLSTATGAAEQVHALHDSRLESFLSHTIDTTVRGFVYEATGPIEPHEVLLAGGRIVRALTQRNVIPVAFLTADPEHLDAWMAQARAAVGSVLDRR
jgi:hypothetical protein